MNWVNLIIVRDGLGGLSRSTWGHSFTSFALRVSSQPDDDDDDDDADESDKFVACFKVTL